MPSRIAVFTSPKTLLHSPSHEFVFGKLSPYLESPERIQRIFDALAKPKTNLDDPTHVVAVEFEFENVDVLDEDEYKNTGTTKEMIEKVHDKGYLRWLNNNWEIARKRGVVNSGDILFPDTFLHRSLLTTTESSLFSKEPDLEKMDPSASSGLYSFDLSAPLVEHTWEATFAAAHTTVHAVHSFLKESNHLPAVFALVRPPGHHSSPNLCGGYCFLNNVAIATVTLSHLMRNSIPHQQEATTTTTPDGANGSLVNKIAVIDIDYHAGNGSSKFFSEWNSRRGKYGREEKEMEVFYLSLHGEGDYPYYTNPAEDTNEGLMKNIPLPEGTKDEDYQAALANGIEEVRRYEPDHLVVSLGVDTSATDPVQSQMFLSLDCYLEIGKLIGSLKKRAVFVMEGGYDLEIIGDAVRGVLEGFAMAYSP